jgi:ABC-2 type transport system ATP-binding protein
MENTADHLIVIGRGSLLADCTMEEFIARSSGQTVRVRTPQPDLLAKAVSGVAARAAANSGAGAVTNPDGSLTVHGLTAAQVGNLAFEHGVRLHELTVVRASLEEAFMELTADSVEYRAGQGPQDGPAADGQGPQDGRAADGQLAAGTGRAAGTGSEDQYSVEGRI